MYKSFYEYQIKFIVFLIGAPENNHIIPDKFESIPVLSAVI